jgi:hypothetical protein
MMLNTRLQLGPRLRMSGGKLLLLLCAFKAYTGTASALPIIKLCVCVRARVFDVGPCVKQNWCKQ